MANPFLVLGGIAMSVIVAGVGAVTAPQWVNSAADGAVKTDLSNIRTVQSAFLDRTGWFATDRAELEAGVAGMKFHKSPDTTISRLSGGSTGWCAVAQSRSGKFFGASSKTGAIVEAADAGAAAAAAKCPAAPTITKFTVTCPAPASVLIPLVGASGKVRWSDGAVQTVTSATPAKRDLPAGQKFTVTFEGTFASQNVNLNDAAGRACIL